jgi:hypothetical protein
VFISLDDAGSIGVAGYLKESSRSCDTNGSTIYAWTLRQAPELEVAER